MTRHLHLSIGPVQTFVAQSRRTRDLWGGSYLLSFLAAHAIQGAEEEKGVKAIRPKMDGDPMLQWVKGAGQGDPPEVGSVPNRLTFAVPENLDPAAGAAAGEKAVGYAWGRVCGAVWDKYVEHAASLGLETEAIWRRQTASFWEVLWVAGPDNEPGLLERRKQWRTHWLPEESGTKCTVISELQELSGYVRARDADRQDAFWKKLRTCTTRLDLQENERLCAVALVKRLYPSVAERAIGWKVDVKHWPSTVDVAAIPWRASVLSKARDDAEAYASAVTNASPDVSAKFEQLEANWFHPSFITSSSENPLPDEASRAPVLERLRSLRQELGGPAIYFALLLADGDRLGKLVEDHGSDQVSAALAKFAKAVPDLVRMRRGFTVYAGGDDVLALLPLEDALDCAREIERTYRGSFGITGATLSAAVVFAHARDPLNWVLAEAHRLLDDVAKDGNGRSSLVAAVYRSTTAVQWVTTWERLRPGKDAVECVLRLKQELHSGESGLSGALVQGLRQTFSLLCGGDPLKPGTFASLGQGVDALALARAEIEHRLQHHRPGATPQDADRLAALIRDVLDRSPNEPHWSNPANEIGVDGLMLASFLAGGGLEDEHAP